MMSDSKLDIEAVPMRGSYDEGDDGIKLNKEDGTKWFLYGSKCCIVLQFTNVIRL